MNQLSVRRLWLTAFAALSLGCDGSLSMSQRLEGDWVGRPESAAERTVREWPTLKIDPDDPEIAAAAAEAPPSDLETFAGLAVEMRLAESGEAELSLAGEQPLTGKWKITPLEGRHAIVEITVKSPAGEDSPETCRRFDVEFLRQGEGFVLREQGADRRFGRLMFQRPGETGPTRAGPPAVATTEKAPR